VNGWRPAPGLPALVLLATAGLTLGFASGRPEPIALVAGFVLVLAVSLAGEPPADVDVSLAIEVASASEGDVVELVVTFRAARRVTELDVAVPLPFGLVAEEADRLRRVALAPGEATTITVPLRCERWGGHVLGPVWLRQSGAFGLATCERAAGAPVVLRVHPVPATLRRLVPASHTQLAAGAHTSTSRGSGYELADVRQFVPGDHVRDVNWRATARHGAVWVNDRHPERSTDVVLFLDAFDEATMPAAVRASIAIVRAHLDQRDRVGLVSFGGTVDWLRLGSGLRHEALIVDALLRRSVFDAVAWRDVAVIPARILPPRALVVVVSALVDPRLLGAVTDLRGRGVDMAVLEVPPDVSSALAEPQRSLSHRLWRLTRDQQRERLRRRGIPVAVWSDDRELAEVVGELAAWPRQTRRTG
jgi:uncharacterized protein (DUF58 family)